MGGNLAVWIPATLTQLVAPAADVGVSFVQLEVDATLSLIRAGLGGRVAFAFPSGVEVSGSATAGAFYGSLDGPNATRGYGFATRLGAGAAFPLSDRLSASVGLAADAYPGLHAAAKAYLGLSYRFPLNTVKRVTVGAALRAARRRR